MARKSVYVNLNPKTDADLINIMDRSTLSDPMFMKTLVRLAIKNNKEIIENMGILQDGVSLKDNSTVKDVKKQSDSVKSNNEVHHKTEKDSKNKKHSFSRLNISVK